MNLPVLITGASSGIGLQTAIYLAGRGFQVIASARDLDRAQALQKAAATESRIAVTRMDVTDTASVRGVISDLIARYGGIGAVVCNAGIQLRGFFEDLSEDEIRAVFETNVFGTMAVAREVAPHMRQSGRGRIVLMSSVGGRIGTLALSAYCSSKFALEGFGECLALEMAPFGVRVVLVEPGIVNTEIWGKNRGVAAKATAASSPYYQWFQTAEKMADWAVRTSATRPVDVARAVYQALSSRRPRLRYQLGRRAAVVLAARRFLPEPLFNAIYSRAVRGGSR